MSSDEPASATKHGPKFTQDAYVLQELVKDISLSSDDDEEPSESAHITCVEHWSQ